MALGWLFGETALAKLVRLNPWAAPFKNDLQRGALSTSARAARSAATDGRLSLGEEAWARWSARMLALSAKHRHQAGFRHAWSLCASVELTDRVFATPFNAAALTFPGPVAISNCIFGSDVWLSTARFSGAVTISNTRFRSEAALDRIVFDAPVRFERVAFEDRAEFSSIQTRDGFAIHDSQFERDCWFRNAAFSGVCSFRDTVFKGAAGFAGARFAGEAVFTDARFEDTAGFESARFERAARFHRASVEGKVWLSGASFAQSADKAVLEALGEKSAASVAAPSQSNVIPFPAHRLNTRRHRKKGA